jgi:replicative DNA helicase
MAGPGLGLLHQLLLDEETPTKLAEHGITEDSFIDEEAKVFRMIRDHFESHGVLPQLKTIEEETEVKLRGFPSEPLSYWVDRVKSRNRRRLIIERAEEAKKHAQDGELDDARNSLQECLLGLDDICPSDRVRLIGGVADEVISAHDTRQRSTKMSGVSFGIEYIDMVTDGAQPGDSTALVARPGMGKTYLLLKSALSAWESGQVPLFHSMEMASIPIVRRLMALRTKIPAINIRTGRLSHFARRKLVRDLAELKVFEARTPFYLLQGDLTSTVEDLVMRVRELKPTVLYVDGAYLLRTRSRMAAKWERVAETAEMLKRIASEFLIPSIATYQFNRRGPGSLGNIAFSDTVGQLASIVLGLSDEQGSEREASFSARTYKILHLIKGREGEKGTVRVLYDMERMVIEQESILHGYDEWEV